MATDEQLLKLMIRTNAYMHRTPLRAADEGEMMSMRTRGFGSVLDILAEQDGITQGRIAEIAKLRQPSVSEALLQLENRRLIVRVPSESDRRISLVYITEEGRAVQRELFENRQRIAESFFAVLSQEEKDELYKILQKLGESFS